MKRHGGVDDEVQDMRGMGEQWKKPCQFGSKVNKDKEGSWLLWLAWFIV